MEIQLRKWNLTYSNINIRFLKSILIISLTKNHNILKNSYKTIAKTTGIIGVTQIIVMVLGIIRTKVIAILLGTSGMGYWGLYTSLIDISTTISGLGLNASGVRQISKANALNDLKGVSKSKYVLKFTVFVTSIIGATFVILFSKNISKSIFGSPDYYIGVITVSTIIIFNNIAGGQKAVLNGLRKMKSLAMCQIIGALVGTLSSVILISLLGIKGIPISLAVIAFSALASTWYYVQKIRLPRQKPSIIEAKEEFKGLIGLGLSMAVATGVASIMGFLSKTYIRNELNIETVGIYQACWSISNIYIGTILMAMGVDFMPRLMKVIQNKTDSTKMINEQQEMGTLIASIGILATLIFAPTVLQIFYSNEFLIGSSIIRWQLLGVSLRVLAWPLSYTMTAKGKGIIYAISQSSFYILEFLLLTLCIKLWGIDGLGINYFIGYSFYYFLTWIIAKKLIGYKSSKFLQKIVLIEYISISAVFIIIIFFNGIYGTIINSIILLLNTVWVIYNLKKIMNIDFVKLIKQKLQRNNKIEIKG